MSKQIHLPSVIFIKIILM